MICFKTPGLMDPRSISILALNAKPNSQSPIGYFGTGLKYAIAVLLRNRQAITIYCGKEKWQFSSREINFRGKIEHSIYLNERELPFTLSLGRNWPLWAAYRELYSNTLDENGEIFDREISPSEDSTVIQITGEEFEAVYRSRYEFILSIKPDGEGNGISRVNLPSPSIFNHNIRVYQNEYRQFAFTWNVLARVKLTEDRFLEGRFEAFQLIQNHIVNSQDRAFLEGIFTLSDKYEEHHFTYDWVVPGDTALAVIKDLAARRSFDLTPGARNILSKYSTYELIEEYEPTLSEQEMLTRACSILSLIEVDPFEFKVKFVVSLSNMPNSRVYGACSMETRDIYIAKEAFAHGVRSLVHTLLEEYLHAKSGFDDCSRNFQDLLFDTIINLTEKYVLEEPI